MDSALNAVVHLHVNLGQIEVILVECVILLYVSATRSVHDIAHLESLDGLVLGNDTSALRAADNVGMTLVLLGAPVVSSLRWHF